MGFENRLLINGDWVEATDKSSFEAICPANETVLTIVSSAGPKDVDKAVQAARQALTGPWGRMSGWERSKLLHRLADLLERDLSILAELEALDIGRPVSEPTHVDIPSAIATLRSYSGWADKVEGRHIPGPDHFGRPVTSLTVREPIGVVAAILPWNAPTMIACWKLGPALATGCAVVLKPAEDASLVVLHLGKLIGEAGYPDGVVNILPGSGAAIGKYLVTHPQVKKVTFTGSPGVGARIAAWCAPLFRPLTLELGGKSPQIIMPDVDLDTVVPGVAMGIFSNQGQICAAGSRVLAHESIQGKVVKLLSKEADERILGDPLEPTTTMGSLINRMQMDKVLKYIDIGRSEGGNVTAGGERLKRSGFFVKPTVFSGIANDATIAREEIFGPVAAVIPFGSLDDALAIANDSDYGLSANVWTRDITAGHRLAHGLKAGTVWINGGGTPDPRSAWGGGGKSGLGKELGWSGIQSHTTEKVLNFFY